jgi:hypothetical protein
MEAPSRSLASAPISVPGKPARGAVCVVEMLVHACIAR